MDSPSSTRTTAFAASAASTCAMAAGALATFGAAGIVFGAAGPPLLLASAASAGLAVLFASVANRPQRAEAQIERVWAAWKAAAEAYRTPTKVEPQPEIRWLDSGPDAVSAAARSTRRWFGRHVATPSRRSRLERGLRGLAGHLRAASVAGRLHLARALHRAAMFVAPSRA
ncbi:hypothetical protein [Paludisphaera soli]|uniref:hypothetical protein n=1 Tax=Paludisphaera soli TaxID=2712865 RepID=UPI0013EBB1D2|nr:hypothetical protein [Paludisphaera soli]